MHNKYFKRQSNHYLQYYLIGIHFLVSLILGCMSIDWEIKSCLYGAILFSFLYNWNNHFGPNIFQIATLSHLPDGIWQLQSQRGNTVKAQLLKRSYMGDLLLVLCFKPEKTPPIKGLFFSQEFTQKDWRALQMFIRSSKNQNKSYEKNK
jgi:hypothetical protein